MKELVEDHLREGYQISLSEFAKQGVSWVVTNHEIQYVRPAVFNERICIKSELIEAKESHILVEIVMYDEGLRQIKAVLWTTFTHINLKTGKRETHTADFQQLLNSIAVDHIEISKGLKVRVGELLAQVKRKGR